MSTNKNFASAIYVSVIIFLVQFLPFFGYLGKLKL